MSVTIRLARIGKRNAPAFKIVVANTRDKRNGRFLDVLGHYNPSHNPPLLDIDKDKVKEWQGKGAMTTDAVTKLIEGKYEWVPYTRQNETEKKKKDDDKKEKETPAEADEEKPEEKPDEKEEKETAQPETKPDEPAESSEEPKE